MAFDPFSTIPTGPSDNSPIPAPAGGMQDPFASSDDDDEVQFDLSTGQTSAPAAVEPELRVNLVPDVPAAPAVAAPTPPEPTFSLDLSGTPAVTTVPTVPATEPAQPTGNGLLSLFDRLVGMIDEETRNFEASQKRHQANIATEQRLMEEETKAFERKKRDILSGLETLRSKLGT